MPRFLHQVFGDAVQFAPLGLINMFNSGGALEDISSISDSSATTIHVRCRGPGRFGAYSATRPELCRVDGQQVEFSHTEDGLLAFEIPCSSSRDGDLWRIEILYRTSWICLPFPTCNFCAVLFGNRRTCTLRCCFSEKPFVLLVLFALHLVRRVVYVYIFIHKRDCCVVFWYCDLVLCLVHLVLPAVLQSTGHSVKESSFTWSR